MNLIEHLTQWLQDKRAAGAPNPQQAVLSTATKDAIHHSRVVAVREVDGRGLLEIKRGQSSCYHLNCLK